MRQAAKAKKISWTTNRKKNTNFRYNVAKQWINQWIDKKSKKVNYGKKKVLPSNSKGHVCQLIKRGKTSQCRGAPGIFCTICHKHFCFRKMKETGKVLDHQSIEFE